MATTNARWNNLLSAPRFACCCGLGLEALVPERRKPHRFSFVAATASSMRRATDEACTAYAREDVEARSAGAPRIPWETNGAQNTLSVSATSAKDEHFYDTCNVGPQGATARSFLLGA